MVTFAPPTGYSFTTATAGSNRTNDSNPDAVTGIAASKVLSFLPQTGANALFALQIALALTGVGAGHGDGLAAPPQLSLALTQLATPHRY